MYDHMDYIIKAPHIEIIRESISNIRSLGVTMRRLAEERGDAALEGIADMIVDNVEAMYGIDFYPTCEVLE